MVLTMIHKTVFFFCCNFLILKTIPKMENLYFYLEWPNLTFFFDHFEKVYLDSCTRRTAKSPPPGPTRGSGEPPEERT